LQEDKGIVPPLVNGISYMSLVYFVGENPAPLRGIDVSNALIELLAVTQWGHLDFLIVDMPPGIGDIILDIIRLINRTEFLIVTTSSLLAFETVKKQVTLLCELKTCVIGVIENMKQTTNTPCDTNNNYAYSSSNSIEAQTRQLGLPFFGEIQFDPTVEAAFGDETRLLNTSISRMLKRMIKNSLITTKWDKAELVGAN